MEKQKPYFVMSNRKTKINLILVALGFFFNMSGYFSLEGLQSSLNSNTGTLSLSALYASIVVSSLFLPPLIMETLLCRKTMALGTITYALYTAANFYPKPYTLVPSAIILGFGSSILWSAMRVYISNLACIYARNTKHDEEEITAYFFGIFFAIFSTSMLIGNIMSSLVLQMTSDEYDVTNGYPTTTESMNLTAMTNLHPFPTTSTLSKSNCGINGCYIPANLTNEVGTKSGGDGATVDQKLLYILFSLYTALNLLAVAIFLFFNDELPNDIERGLKMVSVISSGKCGSKYQSKGVEECKTENDEIGILLDGKTAKKVTTLNESPNNMDICLEGFSDLLLENSESEQKSIELKECNSQDDEQENILNNKTRENTSIKHKDLRQFIIRKILETGKFIIFSYTGKLLIPISLHIGVLQAYTYGRFTKYWITCYLGIEYLGYIMATFGLWAAIGGMVVGRLAKFVHRKVIVVTSVGLETTMIVWLLLWDPEKNDSVWLFIGICSISGISFSIHKTILTTIYTIFFPTEKEAASAALTFWDPLGTAIAYALSAVFCNDVMTYILGSLLAVSAVLYFIAENNYIKTKTNEKTTNLNVRE